MVKTAGLKIKLEIDENTAHTCLAIAAMYANANGLKILGERLDNGDVVYWYEERTGRK